jgi:diguanylate cyclase (GGDEF)-like protein/PAS domain S-box-containing protein
MKADSRTTLNSQSLPLRGGASRWRTRTFLLWLVLACLLPGVAGTSVLYVADYFDGRSRLEQDTILTARVLIQSVDAQLLKTQAVAQALSSAGALPKHDYARFHQRAKELLATTGVGSNVVLSDRSGQQLVNTLRGFGQPLPRHGNQELLRRVFSTGQAVVSDIYVGGVLKRPVMSIDVPVMIAGKIEYDLSIGLLPEAFQSMLSGQHLPADWVVAIFDSSGTIVARTHSPEKFVGQKGSTEFIGQIHKYPEGVMQSTTREGIPVTSMWSRSPATNWSVGIGIPRESLERALTHRLELLGAGFAVLLGMGLALAWLMGQRITKSIQALTGSALALGAGKCVAMPELVISEAAEVASAIDQAGKLLRQRTAALEEMNRSLAESEGQFRATFDQAAVGIAHIAIDGHWLRVNHKLCEIVGYSHEELSARTFQDITYPSDLAADLDLVHQVLAGEIPTYSMEKRYVRKDGSLVWINLTVSLVRTPAGAPDYFVSVVEDIQRRKDAEAALEVSRESHRKKLEQEVADRTADLLAANQELAHAVRKDLMTGLQNRVSANEHLHQEFRRLKRSGVPYAVLFMDIDHFKKINDTYGHETGDHVLKQFADTLVASLRESDFVARFGGEEFLALLPETDVEGALAIAEKIRRGISEQSFPVVERLTVSIGVAIAWAKDANEDDAVRRADAALYQAKHDGRNTVRSR